MKLPWVTLAAMALLASASSRSAPLARAGDEPWSTYRGNSRRTGCNEREAGLIAPSVLWVFRSREQFIAAPVPCGDRLLVSGLGAFDVPALYCLAVDPGAARSIIWTKTAPLLKHPVVSAPAISDQWLIFGDGIHQTDGGNLHCLRADDGLPVWELPAPGRLVHLEGSPTVAGGRVYIGGGAAGVLCLSLDRVTLDGKELALKDVQQTLDRKWKERIARYAIDKKQDEDLAVPPSDEDLPKPAPLLVWQQGRDKWHVDAPVAVAGKRVIVASAFLEKEQRGNRSIYSLDADGGTIQWRAPLQLNPWSGASVDGQTIVVGGSSIAYEPKRVARARGQVAAFQLKDGEQKWRHDIPGGVLSCVAIADGLAVATATDGKVRAFDLNSGQARWTFDAHSPFFAPPAIAGDTVYVGDLAGVVRALSLRNGRLKWSLNLGSDPGVQAPGMIYGGPAVQGGRLYVCTCNIEGPHAGAPTAVVCIGAK
jgi:outer membrane protein assembly factor BamB